MNARKTKKLFYNTLAIVFLFGALIYVVSRFVHLGPVEFTDNAQVHRHIVPIQSRIRGYIKEIRFDDFTQVRRGDTLVIIEDAEFRLGVAQAEAQLANALAGRSVTSAGIATAASNLLVSEAGITEAKVQMENAEREYRRYEQLLAQESVTQQQFDAMKTAYEAARARFEQASQRRTSTSMVKSEQTQRLEQNAAAIRLAEATLELARLNLSYTVITAACDGTTGRCGIHVGQLVQPGQNLLDLVEGNNVWVVANYRETQMADINPGCEVEIEADAVPGITFKGKVERISEATGAAFSLIPHDNATGNFVKVEQRVPVRISLDGNKPEFLSKLQSGLNVECKVRMAEN